MTRPTCSHKWIRIAFTLSLFLSAGLATAAPARWPVRGGEAEEIEPREDEEGGDHDLDFPNKPPTDGAGPIDGERHRPGREAPDPSEPEEGEEGDEALEASPDEE